MHGPKIDKRFTDVTHHKSTQNKKKIDKLNFIKIRNFSASNDILKNVKRTYRRKHFQIIYLLRAYHPDYIKNSYNSTTKWQTIQFKNGQRPWIGMSPRQAHDRHKQTTRCGTALVSKEMQSKTTTRYHFTPMSTAKLKSAKQAARMWRNRDSRVW